MNNKVGKIARSSMIAALVCVATMIIKVPSPLNGYVNLGDGIVLLGGWLLGPVYGFFAAAVGSALADLLSGYGVYAPATFVIKGAVALTAFYIFRFLSGKTAKVLARLVSAVCAELVMVAGYYVFEGFLYGFVPSAVNILPNAVQGAFGIVIGTVLINVVGKLKIKL